jgi:ribonuclease P protein component
MLAGLKEGEEGTRLGITVTTKVNKRANQRNLLKRRVRELYRLEREKLNRLFPGYCGVVIALQGSTELGFDEIRSQLCFLIRKAEKQFGATA